MYYSGTGSASGSASTGAAFIHENYPLCRTSKVFSSEDMRNGSYIIISGTALCTSGITGQYTYLEETEGRPSYASADNSKFLYFSPKGRLYGIWRWTIGGTLGLDGNTYAYVDSNAADASEIVRAWQKYCGGGPRTQVRLGLRVRT